MLPTGGSSAGTALGRLAAPAPEPTAVPPRPALDLDLGSLLRQAGLHRGMARPFEADPDVVGELLALDLPPPRGLQVLEARRGRLAELVAAGHTDVHPLVQALSVAGHRMDRVPRAMACTFSGPPAPPIAGDMDAPVGPGPAVHPSADQPSTGSAVPSAGLVDSLAEVGRELHLDRVYVFENVRDADGRLWMNLCLEWLREDTPGLFEDPNTRLHPYAPDFMRWIEVLGARQALIANVAQMPERERTILGAEGTVSVVAVPILVNETWWGFLGVDDRARERTWSSDELERLRALADEVAGDVRGTKDRSTEDVVGDRYRAIVEHVPAATYIDALDDGATTIFISPQVEELTGYTAEEWIADPGLWVRILHPEDRARAVAENQRHNETGDPFALDYRIHRRDGRVVWIHDEARVVRDDRGAPTMSLGLLIDVTTMKGTDERVAFLAYHDELTNLPSRAMFEELLDLSIGRAARHDACVAVICVDIDDFRLVNDSLGRLAGDEVLRIVAERLREAARETDLVARRSGDTFLLLLADLEREGDDVEVAVARAESA